MILKEIEDLLCRSHRSLSRIVAREGKSVSAEQFMADCAEWLARCNVLRHAHEVGAYGVPLTPCGRFRDVFLAERAATQRGRR